MLPAFAGPRLTAQGLKVESAASTAWIDFHSAQKGQRTWPDWLENVQIHKTPALTGQIERTTFRLRFFRSDDLNNEIMLRLFFSGTQKPAVSAWSEIGMRLFAPQALGEGLGIPTSQTLLIPMNGVDYVDIDVAGDGSNIRGALLATLKQITVHQAIDFATPPKIADPFSNFPLRAPGTDDTLLFGRVRAPLASETVTLSPDNDGTEVIDFELANDPLMAVVTFEILNANVNAPPDVIVNDQMLGSATLLLPDLADPAFTGTAEPGRTDATFRYTGWLKCQKVIPGGLLRAGDNQLQLQSSDPDQTVAVRAIEIQLKYSTDANTQ